MAPTRLLLDACVLYPPSVRDLLLGLAAEDALQVRVSEGVLDELRRVLVREAGLTPEKAGEKVEAIRHAARTLGALTASDQDCDAVGRSLGLPDPADSHLVDAALDGDCDAIATFNLKDLPEAVLETVGLEVWNPDWLLEEMAKHRHPAIVAAVGDLITRVPKFERSADVARAISAAGLPHTGGHVLTASFSTAVTHMIAPDVALPTTP